MGYSTPIKKVISVGELKKKIFSLKLQPNATPYVTSYYKKDWAFCMPKNKKDKLKERFYKVLIDSKFNNGKLQVGEIFIKGKSKKKRFCLLHIYVILRWRVMNYLALQY